MSDNSINSVLAQMKVLKAQAQGLPAAAPASQPGFANVLNAAVDKVNDAQQASGALKSRFEMGDKSVSLAEVMVASQKANVSFQALLHTRNKFIQAYQDIMNMPI